MFLSYFLQLNKLILLVHKLHQLAQSSSNIDDDVDHKINNEPYDFCFIDANNIAINNLSPINNDLSMSTDDSSQMNIEVQNHGLNTEVPMSDDEISDCAYLFDSNGPMNDELANFAHLFDFDNEIIEDQDIQNQNIQDYRSNECLVDKLTNGLLKIMVLNPDVIQM